MSSDQPPHPTPGQAAGTPAAGASNDAPSFSPDSMNTFVGRDPAGTWCVWTTVDGRRRLVSRHRTRELAEQARGTIRGEPDGGDVTDARTSG